MSARLRRHIARNGQIDWSEFDADAYCADNYRALREDDHEIVARTSEFFAQAKASGRFANSTAPRALDIGTGSNLYPALAMLPFCSSLDLREYSPPVVSWLRGQQERGFDSTWDPFWQAYCNNPEYKNYDTASDVRADFKSKTTIEQASVFTLPSRTWDLGTMFFVACSLSTRQSEFRRAIRSFATALKPGAPFAAAFMTNSAGYHVHNRWFPAVAVDDAQIDSSFAGLATDLTVQPIENHVPVRPGVGMALATGFAR